MLKRGILTVCQTDMHKITDIINNVCIVFLSLLHVRALEVFRLFIMFFFSFEIYINSSRVQGVGLLCRPHRF